jgi:hypothetical protein
MKWQYVSYKTDFMVRWHKMGIEIAEEWIKLSSTEHPKGDIIIEFTKMPGLLKESRRRDPLTRILTRFTRDFVKLDLPVEKTFLFVRAVNAWGGLRGDNPSKIWEENSKENFATFRKNLVQGMQLIRAGEPEKAIKVITNRSGVGISFGSKYLRFLCPDYAVVLDERIRKRTDIPNDPIEYAKFVEVCKQIRDKLKEREICRLGLQVWRLADVEAAIFTAIGNKMAEEKLQKYQEKRAESEANKLRKSEERRLQREQKQIQKRMQDHSPRPKILP